MSELCENAQMMDTHLRRISTLR